jgi:hypothetical protein
MQDRQVRWSQEVEMQNLWSGIFKQLETLDLPNIYE